MGANPLGLSIGSPVWLFCGSATPQKLSVSGDTPRSWVLSDGQKVPKAHAATEFLFTPGFGNTRFYCLTRAAADAMLLRRSVWDMKNRIADCKDTEVLRAVAAVLGMPTGVES